MYILLLFIALVFVLCVLLVLWCGGGGGVRQVVSREGWGKPVATEGKKLNPKRHCSKCGAKIFEYEPKGFCCCNGEVKLPMNKFPGRLMQLVTCEDNVPTHFQQNSRLYNTPDGHRP